MVGAGAGVGVGEGTGVAEGDGETVNEGDGEVPCAAATCSGGGRTSSCVPGGGFARGQPVTSRAISTTPTMASAASSTHTNLGTPLWRLRATGAIVCPQRWQNRGFGVSCCAPQWTQNGRLSAIAPAQTRVFSPDKQYGYYHAHGRSGIDECTRRAGRGGLCVEVTLG